MERIKIGLAIALLACGTFLGWTGENRLEAAETTLKLSRSGSERAFVKPRPWSGYWWSRQRGELVKGWKGNESPLAKYDRAANSLTGRNPGAQAWEADPRNGHYDPHGPAWAGHCNGWSAAAILAPEPREPRMVGGVTFSVADQKALLSEQYMDCYNEFYGVRRDNNFPISMDIRPDLFHRLLVKNIKGKSRSMVADITFSSAVWNYPIVGYESEWESSWWMPNRVKVTTTVHFADDNVDPGYLGTKVFAKTYHYVLFLNGRGEVTGGMWGLRSQFDHPDFVWIPTGDMRASGGENPRLDPDLINRITGNAAHHADNPQAIRAGVSAPESTAVAVLDEAGIDSGAYFN